MYSSDWGPSGLQKEPSAAQGLGSGLGSAPLTLKILQPMEICESMTGWTVDSLHMEIEALGASIVDVSGNGFLKEGGAVTEQTSRMACYLEMNCNCAFYMNYEVQILNLDDWKKVYNYMARNFSKNRHVQNKREGLSQGP
jgi:hypothetical protein